MSKWEMVKLGEVLKQEKDAVIIQPQMKYKQVTVRMNHLGITLRGEILGQEIGSSQFLVKKNYFIVSKIDARNGAMGIVPDFLEDAVVTQDFLLFSNSNLVLIDYLKYVVSTVYFDKECKKASEGTTNRQRLKTNHFLEIKIPLPPLSEQERIVARLEALECKVLEVKVLREQQEQYLGQLRYSIMCDFEKNHDKRSIGSVSKIEKGTFPIMKTKSGIYPFVVTAEERKTANGYDFDCEAVCIPLVSSTGHGNAAIHRVHYESGKFALANLLCAVIPDEKVCSASYLYHLFMAKKDEYFVPLMQGTSNVSLNIAKIASVRIPIPPLSEQARIVALLDGLHEARQHWQTSANGLSKLLPNVLEEVFSAAE
jgi:type I restriction enzyme, S subunit